MDNRKRYRLLSWLIAGMVLAVCLHYLITAFKWGEILPLLAEARLWLLLGGGSLATIAYWLLRTLRFSLLLGDGKIPFRDLYLSGVVAMSLSIMTPGQSGEFLKVELLKRAGHVNRLPGYSAFVVERGIDAAILLILGLAAALWQFHHLLRQAGMLIALLSGGVALLIMLLIVLRNRSGRVGQFLQQLRETAGNGKVLAAAGGLTIICWLLVAAAWGLALASVNVLLNPAQLIALMAIVTLVNLASMVPGGLGVSEVSGAAVLAQFGIAAVSAQTGMMMIRAYGLLILLLGVIHWLWWRRLAKAVVADDTVAVG